jgi:hypothetical protein
LNTSQHLIPQSREQHNAIVLDGDLFIYGGKRRLFYSSTSIDGAEQNIFHADEVFGDLWRLRIQHSESFNLHWPNETQAIQSKSIPQNSILLLEMNGRANNTVKSESDGISPREGLCVDNIIVKVNFLNLISTVKNIFILFIFYYVAENISRLHQSIENNVDWTRTINRFSKLLHIWLHERGFVNR